MSRAEGRSNELHSRPRNLTGGTLYAVRGSHRPIRQGDRVKDTTTVYVSSKAAQSEHNYPGCAAYGTVIAGPQHVLANARHFCNQYLVRFDDGYEGWTPVTDLTRL